MNNHKNKHIRAAVDYALEHGEKSWFTNFA